MPLYGHMVATLEVVGISPEHEQRGPRVQVDPVEWVLFDLPQTGGEDIEVHNPTPTGGLSLQIGEEESPECPIRDRRFEVAVGVLAAGEEAELEVLERTEGEVVVAAEVVLRDDVHDHQACNQLRVAAGEEHRGFAPHRVAEKVDRAVFVQADPVRDVGRHGGIGVDRVVGGFTMVAGIQGKHAEVARELPAGGHPVARAAEQAVQEHERRGIRRSSQVSCVQLHEGLKRVPRRPIAQLDFGLFPKCGLRGDRADVWLGVMNVGIVGAAGYSGEVLVELLARHPRARLVAVTSRQHAGKLVPAVMPALRGLLDTLAFTPSDPAVLAARTDVSLWFLALPHGAAAEYARALVAAGRKVIDLSADFRLRSTEIYKTYYQHEHPAPELLEHAVYALPELSDTSVWSSAKLLASPGCYPTSILVPLVPLVRAGLVDIAPGRIVVNSCSGVSGAGKKAEETYLFCERAESMKAYGIPKHRHLSEVEEQLALANGGKPVVIQFTPHLAPMRRGIATTITVPIAAGQTLESVYQAWNSTYAGRPFVRILEPGNTPDTAHVTRTNRVDLSAVLDPRTGNLVITSAEDNLVKGASGQAIQAMNLWNGWPETDGLL